MMKYEKPDMNISVIGAEDIVTTSGFDAMLQNGITGGTDSSDWSEFFSEN